MPRAKSRLRDWLFGAPGKRRLLKLLVDDPGRSWTQADLARNAGMHPKGSADEHLLALAQIGLVSNEAGRYQLRGEHPLAGPLTAVLAALDDVQDVPVNRPGS